MKARSSARRSLSLCAHSHLVSVRLRHRLRLKARARARARARVRVRVRVRVRARDRAHHWSLTKPGPASTTHLTTPKSTWRSSACRICSYHLSRSFLAPACTAALPLLAARHSSRALVMDMPA